MFRNLSKKVTALLASTVIATTLAGSIPVYAANPNVGNTTYDFNIKPVTAGFVSSYDRAKYNSTKVYVYTKVAPSTYTQVRIERKIGGNTYNNETRGTTAVVKNGVESSITNYCFEHRESGQSSVICRPSFRSNTSVGGNLKGEWSPDSTKNYTVVN